MRHESICSFISPRQGEVRGEEGPQTGGEGREERGPQEQGTQTCQEEERESLEAKTLKVAMFCS